MKWSTKPNILLIMADDLGYECLGSYGGRSYKTPNLDALAASGIRFTHCFSTPKCSPSRVTIMTGRYTLRTTTEWGHIPPGEITFGNLLRDSGYTTALAGKWQMVLLKSDPGHVRRYGFDESAVWGWHEGPRYFQPLVYHNDKIMREAIDEYGPDVYCRFLIEFMERNKDRPFLAYYPMALVHWPKKDEPPGPEGRHLTFVEMVEEMDRQVGKLIGALDRLGLRRKTLVLFTGDNGTPRNVTSELRGGRTVRGGKGTLTDAGTRVPLIASWPGTVAAGVVNDDLVDFSDFLPTLAELAGAPLPRDRVIDGRSFAATLSGESPTPRKWVYTWWDDQEWVRSRHWKLYGDGRLVHVAADPREKRPVRRGAGESTAAGAARRRLAEILEDLRRSASRERQERARPARRAGA